MFFLAWLAFGFLLYLPLSQMFYLMIVDNSYTSCYRCKECSQVHPSWRHVCVSCGEYHESGNMIKEVGKWEYKRYPTKILFYDIQKIWRSKEEKE